MVSWLSILVGNTCDVDFGFGQGESGVGKTTFVNTLFTTTIKEPKNLSKRRLQQQPPNKTVQIQITKAGKKKKSKVWEGEDDDDFGLYKENQSSRKRCSRLN